MALSPPTAFIGRGPLLCPYLGACWIWTGGRDRHGYGSYNTDGGKQGAHRAVYEAVKGEIPAGLDLDHLCRTPSCVNPAHLEPVTRSENIRRGALGQKRQCPQGHLYDSEEGPNRYRRCRTCRREQNVRSKRKCRAA